MDTSDPVIIQMALGELNGSQNRTKSHEHRKATGRVEQVGWEGVRNGRRENNQNALETQRKLSNHKVIKIIIKVMFIFASYLEKTVYNFKKATVTCPGSTYSWVPSLV